MQRAQLLAWLASSRIRLAALGLLLLAATGAVGAWNWLPPGSPFSVRATRSPLVVVQDLGVIPPGSAHTLRFKVVNPSDVPWTLANIRTGCACTVAQASGNAFPPGDGNWVDVAYTALQRSGDDVRAIDVTFHESAAPLVQLQLRAAVRAPLVCSPDVLDFGDVAEAGSAVASFEVANWSAAAWGGLAVKPSTAWLTVVVTPLPVLAESPAASRAAGEGGVPAPREAFRVDVAADLAALSDGDSTAELRVVPAATDCAPAIVRVHARRAPPVRWSPGTLFFGAVPCGEEKSAVLTVVVRREHLSTDPPECSVPGELQDQLALAWSRAAHGWRLQATWRAPELAGDWRGELRIRLRDANEAWQAIPIVARATPVDEER